jgi:hypothetical protein
MKAMLTVLCILTLVTVAWGAKPPGRIGETPERVECTFTYVAWEWDFAMGDMGFTTSTCDTEGLPVWQWGTESTYFPAQDVWGTILNAAYPNQAGEALISPSWLVDDSSYLVELIHWFDIETSYDGGNLMVNGVVVPPIAGYPDDELSDSTFYYAWCVDSQPGFTGHDPTGFFSSCFDLSAFVGQEVELSLQFGTDSSVTYPGWYLAKIIVGGDVVDNESQTWTELKALYK